jgi:predicted DNA binding CopG/RHH family protein
MKTKPNGGLPTAGAAGSHAGQGRAPDSYDLEDLGDQSFEEMGFNPSRAAELDTEVRQMTAQAERDIAARVNFRWEEKPLNIIRQAAALSGVPYQTYMKVTLVQRALEDIAKYNAVIVASAPK